MRFRVSLFTAFVLSSLVSVAAQTLTVSSTKLAVGLPAQVVNGQICFSPRNNNGYPIGFSLSNGGVVASGESCAQVSNGAFSIILPDTSTTRPANVCLQARVFNGSSLPVLLSTCVQPSSTASWCNAGTMTCNFDNWNPGLTDNTVTQMPNLQIGTVTQGGSASATLSGPNPNYSLNLVLPQGPQGPAGTAAAAGTTNQVQVNNGSGQLAAVPLAIDSSGNAATPGNMVAGSTPLPTGAPAGVDAAKVHYSPNEPLNAVAFGAVADANDLYDCSITAGSATLTCPDGNFSAAANSKKVTIAMGAMAVVNALYQSGITATGTTNQSCVLTGFNGGGSGAQAYVYLTGTNTIAAATHIYFTSYGSGYTSAPTSATAGNGTATCSGTVTLSNAQMGSLPVQTTATYVNATTLTLGANATTTISSGLNPNGTVAAVSVYTDNTTALQSWLNACQAAAANSGASSCYLPAGQYGYTGSLQIGTAPIKVYGDGVFPVWGDASKTGYSDIMPVFAPFLTGSVLVNASSSSADAIDVTVAGDTRVADFGIRFAPEIAFWQTGNGIVSEATPGGSSSMSQMGSSWDNVRVWGQDGNNHYAFRVYDLNYWTGVNIEGYGGGGISFYARTGHICCSGNFHLVNPYFETLAGSSYGIQVASDSGTYNNLITMDRPQANFYERDVYANSPLLTWPIPAANGYAAGSTYIDNNQTTITLIGADFESNGYGGSGAVLPTTRNDFVSLGGHNAASGSIIPIIASPGPSLGITLKSLLGYSSTTPAVLINGGAASGNDLMVAAFPSATYAGAYTEIATGAGTGNYNLSYLGFYYAGNNSSSNYGSLGMWGDDRVITWWPSGYVGIGNGSTAPVSPLTVDVANPQNVTAITAYNSSGSYPVMALQNSGTVTGYSALASLFAPNAAAASVPMLVMGTAASSNNDIQMTFYNAGAGSTSNFGGLGLYGHNYEVTWWPSGYVGIGNGSTAPAWPLTVGGAMQDTVTVSGGTQTISGCSLTSNVGGASAGQFAAGATSCTVTITPGITAPHGFWCSAQDLTTPADAMKESASTTTTCTLTGTVAASDVIAWHATAY